ncbi:hypothetical protein KVT40_007784 [Elsinoe batatas]|uniref:SGNH hydrolase-type esterase domain-containing protein n=1 Tax=Elsinoe batatas TaxID=2601811 RepID=A0A8K0KWA5_9PEZI|nr:hypothetical protein KVT40_007784 [Elsinoe batatas]
MAAMDQIVLFGDSLTQFSGDQSGGFAFKAALEDAYIRKLDVLNRGFGGYNTNLALRVLPHLILPPSAGRIRLFILFLGANDARLPGTPPIDQCVSLSEYIENIKSILSHKALSAHQPQFLLITPPPIDERLCKITDQEKGYAESRRSAAQTATYAQAIRDIGQEKSIPVVDLWTSFLNEAGCSATWDGKSDLPGSSALPVNDKLRELLSDGLHFTGQAYRVMFREVMKTINEQLPELNPERMQMVFPEWKDEAAWQTFDGPRKA